MIDNVCLGFWSLNLIHQFPTIAYFILLCDDIESNPGLNSHNLKTFEEYEKNKENANLYPCFVYTNFRSVNKKHAEISVFCSSRTHKHA